MPYYEFVCQDCGLKFEELFRSVSDVQTHPCPECKTDASRVMSAASFAFAHTPVGGPRPQNTGVHGLDYNADRIIGRDAEQRWKTIAARQSEKRHVLKENPGTTGFDLARSHEGGYRVMKPEERKAAETARNLHRLAVVVIEKTKTEAARVKKKAG